VRENDAPGFQPCGLQKLADPGRRFALAWAFMPSRLRRLKSAIRVRKDHKDSAEAESALGAATSAKGTAT
jgi:hypothetical protein